MTGRRAGAGKFSGVFLVREEGQVAAACPFDAWRLDRCECPRCLRDGSSSRSAMSRSFIVPVNVHSDRHAIEERREPRQIESGGDLRDPARPGRSRQVDQPSEFGSSSTRLVASRRSARVPDARHATTAQ